MTQESTLQEYMDSFNLFYSKAGIQEDQGLSFFLSGLADELQMPVRMFKPGTIAEACSLARSQGITAAAIWNKAKSVTELTTIINTSFLVLLNPICLNLSC